MIWGYFAAAFPYLLPTSLTISGAAAASATLTSVIVVFGVAAVTVVPVAGPALLALAATGARALWRFQRGELATPVGEGSLGELPAHLRAGGNADPAELHVVAEPADERRIH